MQTSPVPAFLTLIRWKVSAAVTLSAFAAMVVYTGRFSLLQVFPVLGIFLLASGASALNQYQERETDALMERTKSRPIPSGNIQAAHALIISLALLFPGALFLASFSSLTCLISGILNVCWYNGLYTWLKKKTAFAVVPGALTGAIPVYMGWTALGGSIADPEVNLLAFFIFIWQMPHFWLLMLAWRDDYRKAGLPSMTDQFTTVQLKSVILGWLVASAGSSFLLLNFGLIHHPVIQIIIILMNILILLLFMSRFFFSKREAFRELFISINFFLVMVLLFIIADVMIHPH